MLFNPTLYYSILWSMALLAVIVFIALQKFEAAYGMTYSSKWGPSLPNKAGWVLMEAPSFIIMAIIWALSPRAAEAAPCVMAGLFELHYFRRSFIFPFLMRGKSRMPLAIPVMGIIFNSLNAYLIGGWLFYLSPAGFYTDSWLYSPLFITGAVIFFAGMGINLHSDHVIRTLRAPGDTKHYIPRKGLYRWVTGANYFGEFIEWVGFAILTWSAAGAVFALWTFANLAPRAKSLSARYAERFGEEYTSLNRRHIIPFIY